jgi:fucose 4-O-acetylase-like acetyltransferase
MSLRKNTLSGDSSQAIRIARVLCITFMMFVHVWPGAGTIVAAPVGPGLHLFYTVLIDELARASVPLLSVISGFLFFDKAARSDWLTLITGKARTLLVPMILWSAILLALQVARASLIVQDQAFFDVSLLDWLNRLFAITAPPANLPLAFLRDIFLCCCFALLASRLDSKAPNWGTALLLALLLSEIIADGVLLLRPQIFLFFSIGYLLAKSRPVRLDLRWTPVLIVLAADLALRLKLIDVSLEPNSTADVFHRVSVAMLMWRAAFSISQGPTGAAAFLYRQEPLIFVVFCGHSVIFAMAGVFLGKAGIAVTSPLFPLILIGQIVLVFFAASVFRRWGTRSAPGLYGLLSAETGRSRRAPSVTTPNPV